jgi:hypothetical protein
VSEYLPIAIRAYTEQTGTRRKVGHKTAARSWRQPDRVLVFDCETEIDAGQTLTFGSYRYCKLVEGWLEPIDEGLFHADDLGDRNPHGLAVLAAYAEAHALPLMSRRLFVEEVFFRSAYRGRAWVVGFNLPFDLSRIIVDFAPARDRNAGGHSLVLWDYENAASGWIEDRFRPRVVIKSLDSKRAFISFGSRLKPDRDDLIPDDSTDGEPDPAFRFRGHFLDLRALAFALTNESHSLASACKQFGVETGKLEVEEHGVISDEYIDYNRRDTLATSALFEKLLAEHRRHPIGLPPPKAYSPASVAKAYLRALGVVPILARQPDFPAELLGAGMVGYYGGRSECRIRRVPVPITYVDFLSMYATVNTLMRAWSLLTANRVEPVDVTDETRQLLQTVTLEDCFNPGLWPQLLTLVQVEPEGQLFPARADYGENGQWQIGNNPLTTDVPLWYPLADVVAAMLRDGKAPQIERAMQLQAVGQQEGLRPVRLRGSVEIEPARQDFFATVIEQRRLIKRNKDLDPAEQERLQAFLKVLASSGCYGIFAEQNETDLPKGAGPVNVYGINEPFAQRMQQFEQPGAYAFPPLAACITAAARLMLALLEQLVTNIGSNYAFCDTDSMAIVATEQGGLIACPGGPHRTPAGDEAILALSYADVDAIIARFETLNPYNRELVTGSILELEDWNLDPETGDRRQLYCYAISAKRYALYNLTADGRPILRKPSEHGLGHLLNPTDPDSPDRDWIRQAWQRILDEVDQPRGDR